MWFSEHFFAPKLAGLIVTPIVSATVEQKWREKMSEKPHSILHLRRFNFSQSGSRKTVEKPLKELPWNQQISNFTFYIVKVFIGFDTLFLADFCRFSEVGCKFMH